MIEQLPEPQDLPMPENKLINYPSVRPRKDCLPALRER